MAIWKAPHGKELLGTLDVARRQVQPCDRCTTLSRHVDTGLALAATHVQPQVMDPRRTVRFNPMLKQPEKTHRNRAKSYFHHWCFLSFLAYYTNYRLYLLDFVSLGLKVLSQVKSAGKSMGIPSSKQELFVGASWYPEIPRGQTFRKLPHIFSGWWFEPLWKICWKIWVRQLGWWNSQYMGK